MRFMRYTALVAAGLTCLAAEASAQAYPTKPIRMIVPFPSIGAADLFIRTIGQKLTEAWGQQIVVDNRPGAGGNLGVEIASRQPADGYHAVMAAVTTNAIGMSTYAKLGYDLERDLVPVALVGNVPHVLVVHPTLPVKNVKELVALARSRPNALAFASQGPGTLSHLEQELLKQMTGFKALHVPYKGSAPGLSDLMAGHVQIFFDSIPSSLPQVKAGRVRALGVASGKRQPAMPDTPAIGESVPGFAADSWFGILMPVGAPKEIVAKMSAQVLAILAMPDVKEKLISQGGVAAPGGPEELSARIRADLAKWGKVARSAGVKIE